MKRLNAARPIFWLAIMFAIVFLVRAESGDKRTSVIPQKEHATARLRIFDQNGQPAVSGVPSPTGAIFDVAVGQGGDVFVPDTVNISVGDTVRWTWAESGHSVTSGPPCVPDSQYCSPNDMNCFPGTVSDIGFVYQHTFTQPGTYSYHCIGALRYWHDWCGQCFRRLRAIGMVSRSGPQPPKWRGPLGWRLFSGQREVLRHGRPQL